MHDPSLVTLSVLIATLASYTALDLSGRIRAYRGGVATAWLAASAIAMGGGIWAMHFVAMLAYSMPGLEVSYDPTLTLASLLIAILVTGIGFRVASRPGVGVRSLGLAGLIMGLGIVTMHYTGMQAMRMHAHMRHDPLWVAVAALIAVVAATGALRLTMIDGGGWRRVLAAVAMGLAVSGMHYAAMLGAHLSHHDLTPAMEEASDITRTSLVLAVAGTTFVILFLSLVAALFDRRMADLSAREAAALRLSEVRAHELYRQTPLPLHALDANGIVEQVSDEWLHLLGYGRESVVGRPLTDFMDPLSAGEHGGGFVDGRHVDCRFVASGGKVLDVLLSTRVERDASGGFMRSLGGLVDVTAHRHAESALRQAQKIEAIGQLTGGVAHDFNNLLAVVLGNLELLGRSLPDDPRLHRLHDGAVQGAKRGAALTQRLLAFSRRQDLRPQPVAIEALVDGISSLVARAAGPTVSIEASLPPDLPRAQVDANQLELAIVNLAVNARDAMASGGSLRISGDAVAVGPGEGPRGLPAGAYLRLCVADTGQGMDEATLARASEPFFTTKGLGKGTGLGLSMVQGLAEQSGGCMVLESSPGAGTRVWLWLPVAEGEPEAVPEPEGERTPSPAGDGLRVLVVDDDPLVLLSTVEMLRDLGYATLEASSGEEALAVLDTDVSVDVVVTDHAMPGMTGTQLAGRLTAETPWLPILIVTGYAEIGARSGERLPTLGKPFAQEGLARAVRACIESAAGRRVAAE